MKVLVTGGHLTPALAVIQKLPKDIYVVYVGRKHSLEGDTAISLEYQTMQSLKIPFIEFHAARLQRKLTRHTIPSLKRLPKGIWGAFQILRQEKPDMILSFGGYVAFPFAFAGSILKIPVITHEQTLEAGGTNKLIARFASKICVSFPTSLTLFPPKKTVLTGNPLVDSSPSGEIQKLFTSLPENHPVVTITGGSQGSHAINALIEPIIEKLLAKYVIVHQTGDSREFRDYEKLLEVRNTLPETFQNRYIIEKFFSPDDIGFVYKHSSLVVSRSGMNTVLTLLLADTPSLLIPLPFSQRQEQLKNALFLKEAGLGEVLLQDTLTSQEVLEAVDMMLEKKETYHNKDLAQMQGLHEHAAENIIQVLYDTKKNHLQKKD